MNSNELYDMLATLVDDTVATDIPGDFFKNASEGASAKSLNEMICSFREVNPEIAERIEAFASLAPVKLFVDEESPQETDGGETLRIFDLDPEGFMFVMMLAKRDESEYFTCTDAYTSGLLNKLCKIGLDPLAWYLNDFFLDFEDIGQCLADIFTAYEEDEEDDE